ncbi:hypothetical protein STAFG_8120 [Streptomyces afghaniensis 772]|uniref:Uncharacterized protein n=1 Tax=Streptomyces afghaniensis 772 TaxID=1283301 RepID=S4MN55_9ACTN|nr:hypothetical protein STAFG_8120 [Streptomyces afghaniensis 772]
MTGREDGNREQPTPAGPGPAWAEELLEHLRPAGRDVRRVVDWLAGAVRGSVALQDTAGNLMAGTRLPLDEGLVTDITAGRIASAAWESRERHQRLVRVGHPSHTCVLAVSREAPFDRRPPTSSRTPPR